MGESTIIPGETKDGMIHTALGAFAVEGAARHIAIRPEHVQLGGKIAVTVTDVVYQGSFRRVTAVPLASPNINLLARLPAEAAVKPGDMVQLGFDSQRVIILKD
jgi:spermidine/putrescine transport system ATP-binding protein